MAKAARAGSPPPPSTHTLPPHTRPHAGWTLALSPLSASSSCQLSSCTTSCLLGWPTAWQSWKTCPTASLLSHTSSRRVGGGWRGAEVCARVWAGVGGWVGACVRACRCADAHTHERARSCPPRPPLCPLQVRDWYVDSFRELRQFPKVRLLVCVCAGGRGSERVVGRWGRFAARTPPSPPPSRMHTNARDRNRTPPSLACRCATRRTRWRSPACYRTSTAATRTWCQSWPWAWRVSAAAAVVGTWRAALALAQPPRASSQTHLRTTLRASSHAHAPPSSTHKPRTPSHTPTPCMQS